MSYTSKQKNIVVGLLSVAQFAAAQDLCPKNYSEVNPFGVSTVDGEMTKFNFINTSDRSIRVSAVYPQVDVDDEADIGKVVSPDSNDISNYRVGTVLKFVDENENETIEYFKITQGVQTLQFKLEQPCEGDEENATKGIDRLTEKAKKVAEAAERRMAKILAESEEQARIAREEADNQAEEDAEDMDAEDETLKQMMDLIAKQKKMDAERIAKATKMAQQDEENLRIQIEAAQAKAKAQLEKIKAAKLAKEEADKWAKFQEAERRRQANAAAYEADNKVIMAMRQAAEAERQRLAEMERTARYNARVEAEAISISAANEAMRIQLEVEAQVRAAQALADAEARKAATAIAMKQAEVEKKNYAISIEIQNQRRQDLMAMRGADVAEAERIAMEARSTAISISEQANAQAKMQYEAVISAAKFKLTSLQSHADSIQRDWQIKVKVVARASALAEAAKKNALRVQTVAAANAALYKARVYAQAKAAAESQKMKSMEAWANVTAYYAEMMVANAKARAILFQQWESSQSQMRVATIQVSEINNDLISKARKVVEQARTQQFILIKAREANMQAQKEAEVKREAAYQALVLAKRNAIDTKFKGDTKLAYLKAKAEKDAADQTQKELAELTRKNKQTEQSAEDQYSRAVQAATNQMNAIFEQKTQAAGRVRTQLKAAAEKAFQSMKEKIEQQKTQTAVRAKAELVQKTQLEIIVRAKEAQRAANAFREAEAKVKAAQQAWAAKMKEARENARAETLRIRKEVMIRIQEGSEAARIQAEATLRAKQLRIVAYEHALSKALALKESFEITKASMEEARQEASAANQEAELQARNKYATRQSNIWYESYQNYRSSARVEAKYREEQTAIGVEEQGITKLTAEVKSLKTKIAVAQANLTAGTEEMEKAQVNLQVQLEVQARHRQAVEDSRTKASAEARARAIKAAKNTQEKANVLAKITASKMEMHVRAMDATHEWAQEQKELQKAKHLETARIEAEAIQAEAKARARVAAETSLLQDKNMAQAAAAYKIASEQVVILRKEWQDAKAVYEVNVLKLTKLTKKIEIRKFELKKASGTAKKAQLRWKMLAQKRAEREAQNIIHSAEQRERERWEANQIQSIALAKAQESASKAKIAADLVKSRKFSVASESSMTMSIEDRFRVAQANFESSVLAEKDQNWENVLNTILDEIKASEHYYETHALSNQALYKIDLQCKVADVLTKQAIRLTEVNKKTADRTAAAAKEHAEMYAQYKADGKDAKKLINAEVQATEAKLVADKYQKIVDQDTIRNSKFTERDAICANKRSKAEEINYRNKINLDAARKSSNNQIQSYCQDGINMVARSYAMTEDYNNLVEELEENDESLELVRLVGPEWRTTKEKKKHLDIRWCKKNMKNAKTSQSCGYEDGDKIIDVTITDVSKLQFSWSRNDDLEDDQAEIVSIKIQENISLGGEPVWLTMAKGLDKEATDYDGELNPELLEPAWITAKKSKDNERQFRVVMVDECGEESEPSATALKVDAKSINHQPARFINLIKYQTGGELKVEFSSRFDLSVKSYQLIFRVKDLVYEAGMINDLLQGEFTISPEDLNKFERKVNEPKYSDAGTFHVEVVTTYDDDKFVPSKHLPVTRDQVFGDAAIPPAETAEERHAKKMAAQADEQRSKIRETLAKLFEKDDSKVVIQDRETLADNLAKVIRVSAVVARGEPIAP